MNILTDIVELMVGGITGIASGIGSGLSTLVQSVFLQTGEGGATELSVFGTMIIVFAGISLAIGLSRWVVQFLTSLGSRNS